MSQKKKKTGAAEKGIGPPRLRERDIKLLVSYLSAQGDCEPARHRIAEGKSGGR